MHGDVPEPTFNAIPLESLHTLLDTVSLARLGRVSSLWRREVLGASYAWDCALRRDFSASPTIAAPPSQALLCAPALEYSSRMAASGLGALAVTSERRVYARAARIAGALVAAATSARIGALWAPPPDAPALDAVDARLGVTLTRSLRALWLACGGQADGPGVPWSAGVLGGTVAYGAGATSSLFSPGRAVEVTLMLRERMRLATRFVIFAGGRQDAFALDCGDGASTPRGAVYALCHGGGVIAQPRLLPVCAGARALPAALRSHGEGPLEDALLEWLEVYVARLDTGVYAAVSDREGSGGGLGGGSDESDGDDDDGSNESDNGGSGKLSFLSLFPRSGLGSSHACTAGVHAAVGARLAFSVSQPSARASLSCSLGGEGSTAELRRKAASLWPAYALDRDSSAADEVGGHGPPPDDGSILGVFRFPYRVQLWRDDTLGASCGMEAGHPGHRAIQLTRRQWVIDEGDGAPPEVIDGEGVIGLFPRLSLGEPSRSAPFSYASQTNAPCFAPPRAPTRMHGTLFFRMLGADAAREELAVRVAPWEMVLQPFMF